MSNEDELDDRSSDGSLEEMMQHLEKAKQLEKNDSTNRQPRLRGLQKKMAENSNTAVLTSNHPPRLEELTTFDAVTHRAGKRWISAEIAVQRHGRLPIYYRQDGLITHTGIITEMIVDPDPETDDVSVFLEHITDDDTYSEYSKKLDKTTYIVENGAELDEPFSQTELVKVSNDEPIAEEYSRQPSFVYQRDGDFLPPK